MTPSNDLPRFADPALLELVRAIARQAGEAGGRAMLVGGAVRDSLLGLNAKDADLEVYGLTPEALEPLLQPFGKVHLVGRRFAVLILSTEHGQIEVSLPRRESKTGPGHKGFAVSAEPDLSPREAARRRDFTVNAILQDPLTGEVVDPWNGRADLERGVLRHVSPAFAEDPLRALRAARFAARFPWRIAAETAALCRGLDLAELPRERLEGEWREILLHGPSPGRGLEALETVGALRFFPEIAAMRGVPQDPVWHPEGDVFHHTCLALDAGATLRDSMEDPWAEMLGILCHDLGKPATTVFERGHWRCPDHDNAGVEPARSFLARLTGQTALIEKVCAFVREHLRPSQLYHARDKVKDGAIRRLSMRVDLQALVRVSWADGAGRGQGSPPPWPAGTWLLERAANLGVAEGRPRPLLQGRDLIALGMQPGPAMGALLKEAFEAQLEGKLATREDARAWVAKRL